MKRQKYYPLAKHPRSYDASATIKDGFGSEWPEFVLDKNGLLWQQSIVRPGEANAEGWSRWVSPTQPYRFICCDCGLAHDLEFRVMEITEIQDGQAGYFAAPAPREKYRVHFRARRNNRSTAQMRRNRNANR